MDATKANPSIVCLLFNIDEKIPIKKTNINNTVLITPIIVLLFVTILLYAC